MDESSPEIEAEVTDLLQHLIRNRCVNDGTPDSGGEARSVEVLEQYLGTSGFDTEVYEPHTGRRSLVARMEGSDPSAPSQLWIGHTDVVPVNEEKWDRDPFGGELVDGEIWGRGAVDMLNMTAAMAVSLRHLASRGFRPKGTLVYAAVADEEAKSGLGANWLAEHVPDAVCTDYVITETGGIPLPMPDGIRIPIVVAEKGSLHCRIRIRGTAGHASQPFRTDNAVVTAAEVVRRIAAYRPETRIHEIWREFIEQVGFPAELTEMLLDADGLVDLCAGLPEGLARQAHACTHTTFAPTIVRGGEKLNVIPDVVDLDVDVRTLPGDDAETVTTMLAAALGEDLASRVDIDILDDDASTASPSRTPLWDALSRISQRFHPGSRCIPYMSVGATDARWFRRLGITAYGFGMFSTDLTLDEFGARFHGDNERIDIESLRLTTEMFTALAQETLC
ncbi:MAG: M20/M25/M40 family metallo-hydrolase [Acidimicrobiia bacterium]|nr:M20/M25/M40 family metallo-hydrolase [Acidimicrobiia bacterium]